MRKLALFLLIVGLVACGGDDKPDGGMGGAGAAGQAGESGAGGGGASGTGSGGQSGVGGDAGDAGSSGESGEGGEGGEAGDAGGTPVVPLAEVPGEFAGAICDALETCVGMRKLADITGGEDCEARLKAELEAGELAYIDDSITAGRVLYNPSKLEECLDGIREMSCDVVSDTYPDACVDVLAGNVPLDDECAISSECEGTAFCSGRLACRAPQAVAPEGDECLADDECGDARSVTGLRAPRAHLHRAGSEGDDCGGNTGIKCALALVASNFTEDSAGECTTHAEILVGDRDDVCNPAGTLCKDGFSCLPVNAEPEEWRCLAMVRADEACQLALPGQCPNGQYCNAEAFFTEGTCVDLPVDGEACVLTQLLCAPGAACVIEGEDPVCREIVDNGEPCTGNGACRSGNCVDGECAPPTVCE